jgi:phenylacetate-CoA ligase
LKDIFEKIYFTSPVWLQNNVISYYGKQMWRKRFGKELDTLLYEIKKTRELSVEEIENFKVERLKKVLRYASTEIKYYKNLFNQISFSADSVTSLEDLTKIPVLEKETLRLKADEFVPHDIRKRSYAVHKTSGSTGTPLSVNLDKKTYRLVMALLVDHEKQNGVNFGAKRATFAGRMVQKIENMKPPFWRFNSAENQMLFSSYHLNSDTFPFYLTELNKFKPDEIIGYPSAIYSFACFVRESNLSLQFTPKAVITNSETLFNWQRTVIQDVFGCKVTDYYGTSEAVVFAGQCEKLNYHISPLLGELEVVNKDDNRIYGESGDILCTTLSNYAMPLIRYRVGDVGVMRTEACSCGNIHPYLSSVEGRTDDVIVTRDGRNIGRIDHIFKGVNGIKECQVVQNNYDNFTLNMVQGLDFSEDNVNLIVDNLRKRIGNDIVISVRTLPVIPRTASGKFKGVIKKSF